MRGFVFVASFIVLLILGFLATPGVFRVINPEYILALRAYSGPLEETAKRIANISDDISKRESEIASYNGKAVLTKDKDEASQLSVKAAELSLEKTRLQAQKEELQKREAELLRKIEASGAESANLYLVTRALALGAIGALMSIFANLLLISRAHAPFDERNSVTKVFASMAIGAVVSVVVIGLFFTGFISIFSNAEQITGTPNFWKVTILCLMAGAFSDRLFRAASGKIDSYLASNEFRGAPPQVGPTTSAVSVPSPRKKHDKPRKSRPPQKDGIATNTLSGH